VAKSYSALCLPRDVGVGVHGVAAVVDLAVAGVELSGGWHVDEVVPVAVEAGDGAVIDADEEGLERLLCVGRKREQCAAEQGGGFECGRKEPGNMRRQDH
jgi:hypothetical protein